MIETLVQFGVAGLMGALWVWERMHSRRRETQLSEAHAQLMTRHEELSTLVELVRQNTRALVSFEKLQREVLESLRRKEAV